MGGGGGGKLVKHTVMLSSVNMQHNNSRRCQHFEGSFILHTISNSKKIIYSYNLVAMKDNM